MTINEKILNYAKEVRVFTIDEIAKELCNADFDKRKLYKYLYALAKAGKLHRYKKGIYGYVGHSKLTPKGSYKSDESALAELYVRHDEGYVSGALFFNLISLSTWLPAKKVIITNKVKKKTAGKTTVFLPPRTHITPQNKLYLQLLDCLESFNEYAKDAPNPYILINRYIKKAKLSVPTLKRLAKEHYTAEALEVLNQCLGADL